LVVKYQQEFLSQVEDDIKYLIELHWDEIALNKDSIKLNPDWDAYSNLEKQSKLKVFTAREDGLLVGYFVVVLGTNIHYKDHTFANNDVEKCLKEDGVSVLTINIKVHKPFDKVLERLKFKHIERVYSKYLRGE
jgi:hypothetical protein